MSDTCARCQKILSAKDQIYGEDIELPDGTLAPICEGCVTAEERQAIDEDIFDSQESMSHCARCGIPSPDFNEGNPESRSYGDPETQGWYVVEGGLVCAACVTVTEMEAASENLRRGLRLLEEP